MQTPTPRSRFSDDEERDGEAERRIQRLSLHLNPLPPRGLIREQNQMEMVTCGTRGKLSVDATSLSGYMRGENRDLQEKVFAYFEANPQLQIPIEISKDDHRKLCMNQLLGLVRDAGIRPFRYITNDPAKYFAILEAAGSIDVSLGIKMGVQYR